jgi:GNAT superfamily N-acetyltransferase
MSANDEEYTIRELEAHHIQHAVALAERAGMSPNTKEEIDFLRTNETSTFVGLFFKGKEQQDEPIAVVGILHDEEKDYLNLLIVDERHRKKGLGEKLVSWAIDKSRQGSKEEGKALQLVASKMGSPLYKRLGFIDLGYSNRYELKTNSGLKVQRRDASGLILSVKMSTLAESGKGGLLWYQARGMLQEATSSRLRMLRLVSLLKGSTIHFTYKEDAGTGKPTLLAWGAVRRFSSNGLVIGPLLGTSVDDVIDLVQEIPAQQADIGSEQEGDSFVIHTDGRNEQEAQLARAIEERGWVKVVTLEMLELPSESGHSPAKNVSSAQQFALTDFSHQ